MLNSYYTEKWTGFQGVEVKKIEKSSDKMVLEIEIKRKEVVCPCCGKKTKKIHDYRWQPVKDLPAFGVPVELRLRKRRYACVCGKRFAEPNDFLSRYQRRTKRVITEILNKLASVRSYTDVAKEFEISSSTAKRYFTNIRYAPAHKLPAAIGIDEFKGNSGGEKFHAILTDLSNNRVMDIMKTRKTSELFTYFKKCDRSGVRYFISDMYRPYKDIAETYFPYATYVIDKYHWIRQATWAFENVRKEVQKKFSKKHRIYFKHSRKLLLKRMDKLAPDELRQVMIMLDCDVNLSTAYFLKERLYTILDTESPEKQKELFSYWIDDADESGIKAFVNCAKTYSTWFTPITNSFFCPYTNGFTEGCNNKIKVLKRNAYGLRDFQTFRNRILFMFHG